MDLQQAQFAIRLAELEQKKTELGKANSEAKVSETVGTLTIRGVRGSYPLHWSSCATEVYVCDASPKVSQQSVVKAMKRLLWLGSSLANLDQAAAISSLRQFADRIILLPEDTMLIGVDCCKDVENTKSAQNEDAGHWKAYTINGLNDAGTILGDEPAENLTEGQLSWRYEARCDAVSRRHSVCILSFSMAMIADNRRAKVY